MEQGNCDNGTIQGELDKVAKLLCEIEEKVFFPQPENSIKSDDNTIKVLAIKDTVSRVVLRLEDINKALTFLGK